MVRREACGGGGWGLLRRVGKGQCGGRGRRARGDSRAEVKDRIHPAATQVMNILPSSLGLPDGQWGQRSGPRLGLAASVTLGPGMWKADAGRGFPEPFAFI